MYLIIVFEIFVLRTTRAMKQCIQIACDNFQDQEM